MTSDQEHLLEELLERLDDLVEIKVQIGVLNNTVKQVQDQQKSLVSAVKGSNKPGLDERLRSLESANANRATTCPLLLRVQQLEQFRQAAEEAVRLSEQERKERKKEWRMMMIGLIASITMLVLSTIARIIFP